MIAELINEWDIYICKCIWYDANDFENQPKPKMPNSLKLAIGMIVAFMVILPIWIFS